MNIDDMMKQPIDSKFEIKKDDPIYLWLKSHNCLKENMDLVQVVQQMPTEMAKEFIRRMITAQALQNQDADIVRKISRLAFTKPNRRERRRR